MGNFRPNNRNREFNNNRSGRDSGRSNRGFSDGRSGGRDGFRNRSSGFDRGRQEKYEITCAKCGKQSDVPFKPTGNKPVLCSDCFKKDGGSNSRFSSGNNSSSGISQEQFKEINKKLDKILEILETIEVEEDFEDDESEE